MRVFFREMDHGQGRQYVIVDHDLTIVWQTIYASQGHGAGTGNPEFIGKKTKEVYQFWRKFKEVKNQEVRDSIIRGSSGGLFCVPTEIIR